MRERLLLAIESSCDESAVALVRGGREVLAERVASQTAIHAPFGGVIPEVAARAHHEWLPRLLNEVLQEAEGLGIAGEIEGVALTTGPGLVGSLLVGAGVGMLWQVVRFSLNRSKRNFSSASAVVASSYAVLVPTELTGEATQAFIKGGETEA